LSDALRSGEPGQFELSELSHLEAADRRAGQLLLHGRRQQNLAAPGHGGETLRPRYRRTGEPFSLTLRLADVESDTHPEVFEFAPIESDYLLLCLLSGENCST
jgi:hypothetical protein